MDGDSGHDRCGTRSIKKQTLECSVLAALFENVFTEATLSPLQKESQQLFGDNQTAAALHSRREVQVRLITCAHFSVQETSRTEECRTAAFGLTTVLRVMPFGISSKG